MIRSDEASSFDVIVIGSGMGSLATASILSTVGKKKVLVLESHFKLGGFLHSFRRKKWVWDPGVHYVGDMEKGSLTRRCMDLVTGGEVDWHKMSSPFERFIFPEGRFSVPDSRKTYQQQLIERFPNESSNIQEYFKLLKSIKNWSARWFFSKQFSNSLVGKAIGAGPREAFRNTREVIEEMFDEPLLKSILLAQWPDYGTAPNESAFGFHAIVVSDFEEGAYYPIGGSQEIADSAVKVIEEHGGKCLVNHRVENIIIENNRVRGVIAQHKGQTKEFFSQCVISGAGVDTTFNRLVGPEFGDRERSRLQMSTKAGPSANVLYLGLNDDPRKLGFEDCNYWLYSDSSYQDKNSFQNQEVHLAGAFLSFGSLRNPGQEPHTAQIVTLDEQANWAQFSDTTWKKRGTEYEQQKAIWSAALLHYVDSRLPGLKSLVEYAEMSSPQTITDFTGHPSGQIYGLPCVKERLQSDWWSIHTSVRGLYLTGTDLVTPGVNAALMIGVMTAGKLLGWLGMPRILLAAR